MNFRVSKSTIIKTIVVNLVLLPNLFLVQPSSAIDFGFESKSDFVSTFSQNDILFWDPEACANNGNLQSSSHYTGGKAVISGTTAKEKIWSGLKSMGLSDEVAAGTLGNMMHEGGLNPARYEDQWRSVWESGFDWEGDGTRGYGVGLIQWSGGRRITFFKYMREEANDLVEKYIKKPSTYGGLSGDSFIQQAANENEVNTLYSLELTFLMNEIQTNPTYGGVLNETTVDGAANYFTVYIEGCTACLDLNSKTAQERLQSAREVYAEFSGKSSFVNGGSNNYDPDCDCDDSGNIGRGIYAGAKYSFTDDELKRFWWAASAEQGTEAGRKTELSIFANVYEKEGGTPGDNQGLINKITERYHSGNRHGWFASSTGEAYETGAVKEWGETFPEPSSAEIDIAKDILNNGNRVIPVEVDEHDSLSDISSVSNNGSGFSKEDRSQYKSGVTRISNKFDSVYTFFQWANGNKECPDNASSCGDPFGYTGDAPSGPTTSGGGGPSPSNSTTSSNITWTSDGWIQGGIDGYLKEPAEGHISTLDPASGQEFATEAINKSGKGPNKILLHSTEGPNGSGTSGLEFFAAGFVPHFTIDLKEKHLFQHFSLYETAGAIKSHDDLAGIQIEIIGYSDAGAATRGGREQWILANFSDEEVNYLADLLRGISDATGIPLTSTSVDWSNSTDPPRLTVEEFTNYQGILGHRHAPDNDHYDPVGIWDKLEKAIGNYTGNSCPNPTGNINKLQETVLEFAWPDYEAGKTEKRPAYQAALDQGGYAGGAGGVDCGAFVYQTITKSEWDPDFPTGPTGTMLSGLQSSSSWTEVTSSINSNDDAKPGDVIIAHNGTSHHVLLYVGDIPGFNGKMASASLGDRAPMADRAPDISYYIQSGFQVFRKN